MNPIQNKWMMKFVLGSFLLTNSMMIFAQTGGENQNSGKIDESLLIQRKMEAPQVYAPEAEPTGGRAIGDNCTTPIVVNIPGGLPYADLNNTTCGRGNTYSTTDLGYYDGGEDIIYQLNVSTSTEVVITMNPKTTTWTGLGLFSTCPPNGTGNSIVTVTGSAASPRIIQRVLGPGTYYLMADTWPSPTCIPNLDLTIVRILPPEPYVVPFCENFTGVISGNIPGLWTRTHTNWGTYASALAGGTSPEMRFNYSPSFTGTSRMATRLIDATACSRFNDKLELTFKHFVDWYDNPFVLKVQGSLDGTHWTDLWTISPVNNVPASTVSIDLGTLYSGKTFYLAWVFEGNSFNIDYWYIDDICVAKRPLVPVSNWALYVSIFLISAFVIYRFRKLS